MTEKEFEAAVERKDVAAIAEEARPLRGVLTAIASQKCIYASVPGATDDDVCEPTEKRPCAQCRARRALEH